LLVIITAPRHPADRYKENRRSLENSNADKINSEKSNPTARCTTPHIREEELKSAFVQAFNQILGGKEQYIAKFEKLLPLLAETSALEKKLEAAQAEYDDISNRMRRYIEENTR
jgi:hypothetical protein